MNTEQIRKDFEEWMGDGGLSPRAIERNSNGDYILMQADRAWEVWKAAHTHYAKPAAPQPQADAQTAALLERIDCLAESGVCQMTAGGKHAFLKDIRAAIAAAKENK